MFRHDNSITRKYIPSLKPFTVKWITYMYCQYILLLIPVCMWINYVNFLPSVTSHVTVGHRPRWVEDHSTRLRIYRHKSRGSPKLFFIHKPIKYFIFKCVKMPISVAARSKACVCGRSFAEIVDSNPRGGMVVCLFWVLFCQVEVSATVWSLVQRSPSDCSVSLCVI